MGHVRRYGDDRVIRIGRARDGDEALFTPRADFAADFASEGALLPDGLRWTVETGWGRREVLGMGGLAPLGGRRWGVWALMSDLTPRQWLLAGWAAHAVLTWATTANTIFERPTFQAVPAPTPEAVRLLKRIGFVDVGEAYMIWEG
ncbi:hypothetical protein CSW60_18575 [Caulobacter sp. X]|nr:hypothetical protein CSW60_18575 [Caulobacter sp. X]